MKTTFYLLKSVFYGLLVFAVLGGGAYLLDRSQPTARYACVAGKQCMVDVDTAGNLFVVDLTKKP